VQVHFLHRFLALCTGIVFAGLAYFACRSDVKLRSFARLTAVSLVLFAIQALIGAANIWTKATDIGQIAHLGTGTSSGSAFST